MIRLVVADARPVVREGLKRIVSECRDMKLVFAEQVRAERSRHVGLSDREYEVLRLFGSGKSFKHIAAELGVSPKTVSTYRTRILHKLHLDTNAGIIRYAIENRLVE